MLFKYYYNILMVYLYYGCFANWAFKFLINIYIFYFILFPFYTTISSCILESIPLIAPKLWT